MEISKVDGLIYVVRGHKVMLDGDLAELYRVETKQLNRAVRRNRDRFPADFMFELTSVEAAALRCQIGTSKKGRGGRRYLPQVFTEQGVAMLSSGLHGERAARVNIGIMRAFVRLRGVILTASDLGERVRRIERTQIAHETELGEHAVQIHEVFAAIRKRPLRRGK